jgi:hypothetical protein
MAQHAVVQRAGGMHHTAQRRARAAERLKDLSHVGTIGAVGQHHVDLCAGTAQRVDGDDVS